MSAFQSRSRLQPFFFKPCKRHVSAWKHSYWGSFLPQLSHNILSIYLSILYDFGYYETLSLVLLPYSVICSPLNWSAVSEIQSTPYMAMLSISDNLNFPCLVPHGACLLHHYCRAGHFSAGLLLASLVWSTLEPRYRISCSRLKIYGSFSLMVKSASIARDSSWDREIGLCT